MKPRGLSAETVQAGCKHGVARVKSGWRVLVKSSFKFFCFPLTAHPNRSDTLSESPF
jgi:hypothetical protein